MEDFFFSNILKNSRNSKLKSSKHYNVIHFYKEKCKLMRDEYELLLFSHICFSVFSKGSHPTQYQELFHIHTL